MDRLIGWSARRRAAARTELSGAGENNQSNRAGDKRDQAAGGGKRGGRRPGDRGEGFRDGGDARGSLSAPEMAASRLGAEPLLDRDCSSGRGQHPDGGDGRGAGRDQSERKEEGREGQDEGAPH